MKTIGKVRAVLSLLFGSLHFSYSFHICIGRWHLLNNKNFWNVKFLLLTPSPNPLFLWNVTCFIPPPPICTEMDVILLMKWMYITFPSKCNVRIKFGTFLLQLMSSIRYSNEMETFDAHKIFTISIHCVCVCMLCAAMQFAFTKWYNNIDGLWNKRV